MGEDEAVGDQSRDNGNSGASVSGELKDNIEEKTAEASKEASTQIHEKAKEYSEPLITVLDSHTNGFDVKSMGFETDRKYTVTEFNAALVKATDTWFNSSRNDDKAGITHSDSVIISIENVDKEPYTFNKRVYGDNHYTVVCYVPHRPIHKRSYGKKIGLPSYKSSPAGQSANLSVYNIACVSNNTTEKAFCQVGGIFLLLFLKKRDEKRSIYTIKLPYQNIKINTFGTKSQYLGTKSQKIF